MTPSRLKNKSHHKDPGQNIISRVIPSDKSLIHITPTAEFTADNLGFITRTNMEFAKMLGYEDIKEVVGMPIARFFKDKNRATRILAALERVGTWEGEFQVQRKNGSVFVTHVKSRVVRNKYGMRKALHALFCHEVEYGH